MYNTEKFLPKIVDARKEQYIILREEIVRHMGEQRSIITFVIASMLTFYTIIFSIELNCCYVFLLGYVLLVPFSYKILDHKRSISYIVAYKIVCLENNRDITEAFSWETDFYLLKKDQYDDGICKKYSIMMNCEFFGLGLVLFILYVVYFLQYNYIGDAAFCFENVIGYIGGSIALFMVVLIGRATYQYSFYSYSIEYFIKMWLYYMRVTGRIDDKVYENRLIELTGSPTGGKNKYW